MAFSKIFSHGSMDLSHGSRSIYMNTSVKAFLGRFEIWFFYWEQIPLGSLMLKYWTFLLLSLVKNYVWNHEFSIWRPILELFRISNEVKKMEFRWHHTPLISLSQSQCSILSCDDHMIGNGECVVVSVSRGGGECHLKCQIISIYCPSGPS